MAWTSPMTAVANTEFTAVQFNTHIRDNLLETAPAKAVNPGSYFAVSGTNSIAERTPAQDIILTDEGISSSTYTDLATVGPTVTVTTGTNAIVLFGTEIAANSDNISAVVSYAVSGATSIAASHDWRVEADGHPSGNYNTRYRSHLRTDLTPGSNTFTMKYQSIGAAGSQFRQRSLLVLPY